jgi:hypothetical protein
MTIMTTALLGGVLALFLSGLGTLEEGQAAQTVQRAWLIIPRLKDAGGVSSPTTTGPDSCPPS